MEDLLPTIVDISTLALLGFAIFKGYFNTNKKQDSRIDIIENSFNLKKTELEKAISTIEQSIVLIKDNHLKHIETRMGAVENKQTEIITILNERLPKKIKE